MRDIELSEKTGSISRAKFLGIVYSVCAIDFLCAEVAIFLAQI
jgi:hypothetical protein